MSIVPIGLVSRPGNLACVAASYMIATQAHLDFPVVCQVQVWMMTFLLCHFSNLIKELHSCNNVHTSD
jgi:hypothetical protein